MVASFEDSLRSKLKTVGVPIMFGFAVIIYQRNGLTIKMDEMISYFVWNIAENHDTDHCVTTSFYTLVKKLTYKKVLSLGKMSYLLSDIFGVRIKFTNLVFAEYCLILSSSNEMLLLLRLPNGQLCILFENSLRPCLD